MSINRTPQREGNNSLPPEPFQIRTSDGVLLKGTLYPPGEKKNWVVMVHGLGLSRTSFSPIVPSIRNKGYGILMYDIRGFGESELPQKEFSMERLAEDLKEITESFSLPPFHLLGHSLGGMIVQTYAVNYPNHIKSLILLSTSAHNGKRASKFTRLMAELAKNGFETVAKNPQWVKEVEEILKEGFPGIPLSVEIFREGFSEPHMGSYYGWKAMDSFSVKEKIIHLKVPMLVIHGVLDTWIPYPSGHWFHKTFPHARWISLETAGHFPHLEVREIVQSAIVEFLTEVDHGK